MKMNILTLMQMEIIMDARTIVLTNILNLKIMVKSSV